MASPLTMVWASWEPPRASPDTESSASSGVLHSVLGAVDKLMSEEGMKVSCTHFQCAAGTFAYLREHYPHAYSVDMSHQILLLNVNLLLGGASRAGSWIWPEQLAVTDKHGHGFGLWCPTGVRSRAVPAGVGALEQVRQWGSLGWAHREGQPWVSAPALLSQGQAQECLLEKSMLDNRKSFLVACISAQVRTGETAGLCTPDPMLTAHPGSQVADYYREVCRVLENPDATSVLGWIQKDWKKLVQIKIYYFAAVAHLHVGKQAEEQQKFGERVSELGKEWLQPCWRGPCYHTGRLPSPVSDLMFLPPSCSPVTFCVVHPAPASALGGEVAEAVIGAGLGADLSAGGWVPGAASACWLLTGHLMTRLHGIGGSRVGSSQGRMIQARSRRSHNSRVPWTSSMKASSWPR
ncbi:hypothetical protein MC885_017127 [Smutsia gigantea]|nr:hypothetical protein MC885_017127 [Smutsia gigantea]